MRVYVDRMTPRLRAITANAVSHVTQGRQAAVQRGEDGRTFTTGPSDMLVIMLTHLRAARRGASSTLQRRLLCMVVGEVSMAL